MPTIEEYKKPGISLPKGESQEIIRLFRLKYLGSRDLPNWKGNKLPAWCKFKKDIESERVTSKILNENIFDEEENYYLYFEFSKEVWISKINLIRQYFFEKPPWINNDVYIFPPSMRWCIVCNHDDDFSLHSINE